MRISEVATGHSQPIDSMGSSDQAGSERRFELDAENLTRLAEKADLGEHSPFETDGAYVAFFDSLCRALHCRSPRNILLVRERGVGERIVLLELARRGVQAGPAFLKDKQILLSDCRKLDSEQLQSLASGSPDAAGSLEEIILCLDNFSWLLRGHGKANSVPPAGTVLGRAFPRVIGLVSPREFEEFTACDVELRESFSVVHLHEPERQVATSLVRSFAKGLEGHFSVTIEDAAVTRAVDMTDSYILHERLPYKAVRVLQSICDDIEYDRTQLGIKSEGIGEHHVVSKISQLTGIPEATLAGTGERVDYCAALGELIVGQTHAVEEVARELGLIKSGMTDAGKPASVMMFVGQTGTGKTEMAKALAQFYSTSKRLKTFTLGNFSEPHSVSGIIGVPPGYVGHELGGRLVNELNSDPYGVFLLDEADKAHPDVMQPFLNLFDEGWVSDQRGTKAYANRAIFILTTNVGQRQIADMCRSGKSVEEITSAMKESLSRIRHTKSNRPVFSAEFLARVKRIIVFKSLTKEAMSRICQILAAQMRRDWPQKRQRELFLPDELTEAIAKRAFEIDDKSQGREGGRIVRKLFADVIEAPIQEAISRSPEAYREGRRIHLTYHSAESAKDLSCLAKDVRVTFD